MVGHGAPAARAGAGLPRRGRALRRRPAPPRRLVAPGADDGPRGRVPDGGDGHRPAGQLRLAGGPGRPVALLGRRPGRHRGAQRRGGGQRLPLRGPQLGGRDPGHLPPQPDPAADHRPGQAGRRGALPGGGAEGPGGLPGPGLDCRHQQPQRRDPGGRSGGPGGRRGPPPGAGGLRALPAGEGALPQPLHGPSADGTGAVPGGDHPPRRRAAPLLHRHRGPRRRARSRRRRTGGATSASRSTSPPPPGP